MTFNRIRLKPFSVNDAWKGRRYRTDDYKDFAMVLPLCLPKRLVVPKGPLQIYFVFAFSNACADWDNPIKPTQDIIAKYYGFNDNRIARGLGDKMVVKKGQEYIDFQIMELGATLPPHPTLQY